MAEKGDVVVEDMEVTEVVEHFATLTTIEQMRKAFEGVKLSLKIRKKEERDVAKVADMEDEMKAKVGVPPTHVLLCLNGNPVEKIVELEKEYDFTDLSVKELEEAKKWYKADKPSSSRLYGPTATSAYRLWLKWNLTTTGGKSPHDKGDLVKKRDEEAGAAM
jgi:hypothetical protein